MVCIVVMLSSAVLEWSVRKLRSAIGYEVTARLNLTGELEEMINDLEAMKPLLEDAEKKERQGWPMKVRQAAYDISDMVDDLQGMSAPAAGMLTGMLPCLPIVPKKNFLANKMKLMKARLQQLQEEANSCNFITSAEIVIYARITTSDLDLANVVGRVEDKQKIIGVLSATVRDATQGPIILPVFGLGGIGKTTVAQMVFNDIQLQEYKFRAWVHVSLKFDLHKIGMSIISQVSDEDISNIGSNDLEYIMKRLNVLLTGMKVLIVLDDLWEENSTQLEHLKCMLSAGKKVIVIVTTHSAAIARKICSVKPYKLNPLSDEMCWTIIKRTSYYQYRFRKEEIEQVGRELARRCLGVPLAAKELEHELQYKDLHVWEQKLASKIIKIEAGDDLTTSLILSCRTMPPNLKLCFAYSGILKQGGSMVKHDLIHQWIALDFIEPSDSVSSSQIAEEYFSRLLDMSFLQTTGSDSNDGKDNKGAILYTMHGLVGLVAKALIGEEFAFMDGRHGSYACSGYSRYAIVTNFDVKPLKLSTRLPVQLRALHCVGCSKMELNDDTFLFARWLRVLSLSERSMKKLPESVCQLRHLGYLNLSGCSGLEVLPESLGDLINVLHMNLSGCSGLVKLPQSFGNLINLLYIDLSGCSGLVTLPQSFGNLIKMLHIDLSGCYELTELGESFENLEKLVYLDFSCYPCFEEIPVVGGLTNLQHLNLSHPSYFVGENRFYLESAYYLGELTNLRYLNLSMSLNPILYYKSEEDSLEYIDSCISGLSSLEHLDLSHNIFLRDLPESLGDNLCKLHTLDVSGCVRLKTVHRWMGELDFLKLDNCRGLESYQFVVRVNPDYSSSNLAQLEDANYQELEISCLEKVKSTEEAQRVRLTEKEKLRKLKLCWTVSCEGSVEENALLGELMPPQNLQCLELHGYNGETCVPAWWTWRVCSHLVSLVEVKMEDIPRCHRLPPLGLLPNLRQVTLRKMASLTRVDAGELGGGNRAAFKLLSKITIDDMEILEVFMFPEVDELVIRKCPELSFGALPPRARRLVISDSDKVMLTSSPGNGGGAEKHVDAESPSTSATPVSVLVVERCNVPQGDWNLVHHLPGLKTLCISHCGNMTSLPKYLGNLSSLRELAIDGCNSIESLPHSIFKLPNLRALYISDCHPALKIWCEAEENKKRLAPLGLKYEKIGTSEPGEQPSQSEMNYSIALN